MEIARVKSSMCGNKIVDVDFGIDPKDKSLFLERIHLENGMVIELWGHSDVAWFTLDDNKPA